MDVEQDGLGDGCDLDAEVATAAFRIVQECLTNIARHAEAEYVSISLKCQNGKLMLYVFDDGKGMPTNSGSKRNSYGIVGMRERAYGLGGTLDFLSAPGEGTRVEVVLPVNSAVLTGEAQ
jgi:signal transduction histidine kinase